jgi:diacylglycerol kinase family enzyme
VRALLIVNPHATSTTPLRRDVIARALASELDLGVVETRYRGHATRLSAAAAREGIGLVLTLGGDGTVNEAVNGIMSASPARATNGAPASRDGADGRPALAALPGGSANVFTGALGLPPDPVDATGRILGLLAHGRTRRIGLGRAGGRYFTANAGLGLDAEVVRAVEGLRADGVPASGALYFRTAVRHFFTVTDRRHPALTVECAGQPPQEDLFFCIVSNTAPWTFLGRRPVNPSPEAGFGTGLDLFALRRLGTVHTLSVLRRMLAAGGPPRGSGVLALHDQPFLRIRSRRPIAYQVDGEYVGECEEMTFTAVPEALRVFG